MILRLLPGWSYSAVFLWCNILKEPDCVYIIIPINYNIYLNGFVYCTSIIIYLDMTHGLIPMFRQNQFLSFF